jgi:putative transposase
LVEPALERIANFAVFVEADVDDQDRWADVLKSEFTGRPVGAKAWIETLEARLGQPVSPQRRGPSRVGRAMGSETAATYSGFDIMAPKPALHIRRCAHPLGRCRPFVGASRHALTRWLLAAFSLANRPQKMMKLPSAPQSRVEARAL